MFEPTFGVYFISRDGDRIRIRIMAPLVEDSGDIETSADNLLAFAAAVESDCQRFPVIEVQGG